MPINLWFSSMGKESENLGIRRVGFVEQKQLGATCPFAFGNVLL